MRILFVLPGLHRYDRGAETAFISIARELAKLGHAITLMGSGDLRVGAPYRFIRLPCIGREAFSSFPTFPPFRGDTVYEELTIAPALLARCRPADYDVTLTCGYPFINWILRRPALRGRRPAHVFVTENGDWPALDDRSEYRFFGCEGLVCTNPDYYERNRSRWRSVLIANGVDTGLFSPGDVERDRFGLPKDRLVVLMVSALIPSKRVEAGIEAVSRIKDAHLVVAGNGPLRASIEALAGRFLPERFTLVSVPADKMPLLYRSADVFLHMSYEESFGNVYLEAMACGLPVVAHASTRTRWVFGETERLVDTDDLALASSSILEASKSSRSMQPQRIARASAFSWTKIGKDYESFLGQVIESYGRH